MNRKQRRAAAKQTRTREQPLGGAVTGAISGTGELFATALRQHEAGRLDEAERLYRQVLSIDAHHADSLHLLGVITYSRGRFELAMEMINKALAIKPDYVDALSNLGNILQSEGRLDDAISCYERALAIKPHYAEALSNLGAALKTQGRLDEAIARYEKALLIKPDYAQALYNLGLALQEQGRLDEAVVRYEQALVINPNYAEALCNLGIALGEQGRLDEAIGCYKRTLVIKPDYAEALCNLGVAVQEQGRLDEAIARYQQALTIKPDYAEALCNLGVAVQEQGRLDEAIARYQQALTIKPDYAEALCNLGVALQKSGRPGEAIARYEQALTIKPDYAEALSSLGNVLREQGKLDEAIIRCEQALAINPNYAAALCNLGVVLAEQGKLGEARQHFENAIKLDPRDSSIYLSLVDTKRFLAGDAHLVAMEELAKDLGSLAPQNQIALHFALAKAYADLAEHERSFHHILAGSALKRSQITYDEGTTLNRLERMRRVFTRELIEGKQGFGDPSHVPVFIIGMPRSGTTLIEQILASHRKVFGAGELTDFIDAVTKVPLPSGAPKEFPENASALNDREFRQLGTTYVNRIRSRAPEAERITDKMPGNFALAGLIHLALPNARIIHMQRNAVDTCLSCFSKIFVRGLEFTYELGELGRYYKAYSQLMDHWRSVLPAGAMLEVRYEDVVADIEQQARRILDYCGLEWDPSCLTFYKTDRPVRTASYTQVRQPIYGTSVGRWRPYQQFLEPLLKELGLDPPKGAPAT